MKDWIQVDKYNVFADPELKELTELSHAADCLLIHNTASYDSKLLLQILKSINTRDANKIVLMKQDEHVSPKDFDVLINEFNIGEVFTCLKLNLCQDVYPISFSNGVNFTRMFTGYVTDDLLQNKPISIVSKKGRVSYRGSFQPIWTGRLGHQKALLGKMAQDQCKAMSGITIDASSDWRDRIYGSGWIDFIRNSWVLLGNESGSNCFNLDGNLHKKTAVFEETHGQVSFGDYLLWKKYQVEVLEKYEGNVNYATISPRHLEAAVLGVPQILIAGKYEGFFPNGSHSLHVQDDMNDIKDALNAYLDLSVYSSISDTARETILSLPQLRLESLGRQLEDAVQRVVDKCHASKFSAAQLDSSKSIEADCSSRSNPKLCKKKLLFVVPSNFEKDPRHYWWLQTLESQFNIEIWEFNQDRLDDYLEIDSIELRVSLNDSSANRIVHISRVKHGVSFGFAQRIIANWITNNSAHPAFNLVSQLFTYALYSNGTMQSISINFLRYLATIIQIPKEIHFDIIFACDLLAAFPLSFLSLNKGISFIYDAQESFPDMFRFTSPPMNEVEIKFWEEVDNYVMRNATKVVAVTPGLAQLIESRCDVTPSIIPNLPTTNHAVSNQSINTPLQSSSAVRFVYMGHYAASRGIESLIKTWGSTSNRAQLYFYVPRSNEFTDLIKGLKQQGVDFSRIHICQAVKEYEMISTLANFDVGIIPYDYSFPYNHCSPNKFGQYLAAGMCILSNDLPWIRHKVTEFDLGELFTWRDSNSFISAVNLLCDESRLVQAKKNANSAFQDYLNWERCTDSFLSQIQKLIVPVNGSQPRRFLSDLSGDKSFITDALYRSGVRTESSIQIDLFPKSNRKTLLLFLVQRILYPGYSAIHRVHLLSNLARLLWKWTRNTSIGGIIRNQIHH